VVVWTGKALGRWIADRACVKAGRRCSGPGGDCAKLEVAASSGQEKLMQEGLGSDGPPTGPHKAVEQALRLVESHGLPLVVKADGLAAGKGAPGRQPGDDPAGIEDI